jgi:predicted ArsR family transcriptional regulator
VERLAEEAGQHRNTIREHLEALVEAGLARRSTAAADGRGRPAWLYRAVEPATDGQAYAALAAALAAHIAHTQANPRAEGIRAGELWAERLDAGLPPEASGPGLPRQAPGPDAERTAAPGPEVRRRAVEILESVGFGVESDENWTSIRLDVCPLLEAARQTPEVVCAVHLGLVRGSLKSMGADPEQAELIPFAKPGACLLYLGERAAAHAVRSPSGRETLEA